ncbi:MAG TPA: hypothetical protein VLC09_04170 [Polyangiaceae bacterium]|nr:hypothetical protein [Polyangiaceae bacterium]
MRLSAWAVACAAFLAASHGSPLKVAQAQTSAAAEELYRRGVADFQAGRYDLACRELADSYRMEELPGVLFTLATCEARSGRVASASAHYRDFLEFVDKSTPQQRLAQAERAAVAQQERAALVPEIPYLTLVVPRDWPSGVVVTWDGTVLGPTMLGHEMPVDPGAHVLGVRTGEGGYRDETIRLTRGEHRSATLVLPEAPARAAAPVEPSSDAAGWKWLAGGVGVAGIAVGTVAGIVALEQKSIVDDHCQGSVCDDDGLAAVEGGRAAATVSTIGFGVGAAGLVTWLVLLASTGSNDAALKAGPAQRAAGLGSPWGERWTFAGTGINMVKEFQ